MAWMARAAALLYLLRGSLSGAVVHNHHQVGGSAQVTQAHGAPGLEARPGAGEKPCKLAVPHAELNWLLFKESKGAKPRTWDPVYM